MKLYITLVCLGVVAVAVFEYLSKKTLSKSKSAFFSICVVVMVVITQIGSCIFAFSQDDESSNLSKSLDSIKATNSVIRSRLDTANSTLSEATLNLSNILKALEKSNYRYDSVKKEIVPVLVESKFYTPDVHGGNNQFGDGNTQNN